MEFQEGSHRKSPEDFLVFLEFMYLDIRHIVPFNLADP